MKKVCKITLSLFVVLLFSLSSYAQSRTITGNVTDKNNVVIAGVNVHIKGSDVSTVTDTYGNFAIEVPAEGNVVLVFTYLRFATQEIAIVDQRKVNVQMTEEIRSLDEVVVIGYGTQEKKEITSAVSSVNRETFNKGNVNDAVTLLQGKVAGLSISKPGSNPNQGATIRLRGLSTLGGNASPLIVVDGVIGVNLNAVDPNDIESIDVLKDASAAAIYGSRGASGVILITTRKGTIDRTLLEYDAYYSAEEVARTVDVMTAEEFRNLGVGTDFGYNTNWYDEITNTAESQAHNLALSGGTNQTTYRASINYRDIQGIALHSGFNRLNGRLNLTQKALDDRLSVSLNMTSTTLNSKGGSDNAFKYAAIYNPTSPVRSNEPVYEQYGGYFQQTLYDYLNPVALLEQVRNERQTNLVNINLEAQLRPIEKLNVLVRYGRQRYTTERSEYFSKNSLGTGMDRNGYATKDQGKSDNQLFESTATYNDQFESLKFTGLLGYSYQEFDNDGFAANGGNFLSDAFSYNNLGAALDFANGIGRASSYKDASKIIGFFSRINLNYDNTYFLSASLRREGSTMFGEGNKWGNFPAVSIGLALSELIDIPRVDNLKLRASYGVAGNTPPSAYLSLLRLKPIGNFYYDGNWIPSYGPASNANPDLGWEKKAEFDVGADFTLFDARLSGSIDYYKRNTKDLIYPLSVPVPPNLVETTQLNIGEISSSGLEANFDYLAIQRGNFSWTTALNGTYYFANTLVSLSNQAEGLEFGGRRVTSTLGNPGLGNTPATVVEEGQPLGLLWGMRYDGLTEDGNWIFKDLNNDGQIDQNDETVIGNGLPKYQLGFNNTFSYKNFDLNFFIRGTFGHDLINTYRVFYEGKNVATSYNVVNTKYFNPALDDVQKFSDHYVEKGDYVMLDNATLGYTLPIRTNMLSRLRVYLSGQNLFVITGYTGVDPEVRQSSALAPGVDLRNNWLFTRTYTVGIQLGL
ncbi:SusC/RagA family TonB-linked outer membrane protein [Parapedobacter tibetensis]|uniref:SusC/RagA family TonB-linked outer membrane protein n=1 Tax=Parapedobacter tibetensis TaxID=2972951 RepID=UPI00214D39F8|nr:SusC/RagA family TonB-linked outer membrane protein [Parapedobacter tibetensis]